MLRRMAALFVVALMCVASVGAQNTDFLSLIQKGDVAGVKKILSAGADVNALLPEDKMGFRSVTPLYEATAVGNLELITLLLDRKADPNKEISEAESTGPGDTPLCRAARDGNLQIAKLLVAHGAKTTAECLLATKTGDMAEYLTKNVSAKDLWKFYQRRILAAVNKVDVNALAAVAAEMGDMNVGDCPEALLIWYANAPLQLREVVKKYGPADVASAKVNALDTLLRGGINTTGNTKFETLPLPLATSFMPDQKDPMRYAAAKAVDGDSATSWVEGVDGPGVGQKIAVAVPDGAAAISVVPGYGDAQFLATE